MYLSGSIYTEYKCKYSTLRLGNNYSLIREETKPTRIPRGQNPLRGDRGLPTLINLVSF